MNPFEQFLQEHTRLTRRFFLGAGALGLGSFAGIASIGRAQDPAPKQTEAFEQLESLMTLPDKFLDVSRGSPIPHSLSEEKRIEV